ncbi:MAG TPA: hypothetical protein VK735_38140 [Pseudonocardia sp.]|uniref:hypothetical protein n=1 Tax=Pseudonocardia sp. TaxID=60912 RepID=UPI002C5739DB|nr:hypothetical protein [Pseudonocardia sp.]HTF53302.1 hypothetical protein [Pseudonocardia sp.]
MGDIRDVAGVDQVDPPGAGGATPTEVSDLLSIGGFDQCDAGLFRFLDPFGLSPLFDVIVDGRRQPRDQSVVAEAVAKFRVRVQLSVNELSEWARVNKATLSGRRPVPCPLPRLQACGISFDLGRRCGEKSYCHRR